MWIIGRKTVTSNYIEMDRIKSRYILFHEYFLETVYTYKKIFFCINKYSKLKNIFYI